MKTGAEILNYTNFVATGADSAEDFEKLRGRQIASTVKRNREIFDDEYDELEEVDDLADDETEVEVETESDLEPDESDNLVINGGTHIKSYNSYPFGLGTAPNVNRDNGVSKVKKFKVFNT